MEQHRTESQATIEIFFFYLGLVWILAAKKFVFASYLYLFSSRTLARFSLSKIKDFATVSVKLW